MTPPIITAAVWNVWKQSLMNVKLMKGQVTAFMR